VFNLILVDFRLPIIWPLPLRVDAIAHHHFQSGFSAHLPSSPPFNKAHTSHRIMFQVSSQSFYIQPFERKPSPLSPRNPNACPRFSAPMISESKGRSKGKHNDKTRPLQNPLLRRKPEQLQDQRRQVFLKKVRQSGDAKKWEERSDRVTISCIRDACNHYTLILVQILRQQYLAEQKTWEHDQALSAPEAAPVSEDEQDEPRAQDGEENGQQSWPCSHWMS